MKDAVKRLVRSFGYEVRRYRPDRDPSRRFQFSLQRHGVQLVLDVGANVGQFARSIRKAGYQGRIISFEPLSTAHAELRIAAQHDPRWIIAPRCALAATRGEIQINVAANSQSSSVLNMLARHVAGDPASAYVGSEKVTTTTLDSYLDAASDVAITTIALKLDTQGYEAEVLAGLQKWGGAVRVVMTEMSLVPLYAGERSFADLFRLIEDRGYRCISVEPGFTDPHTYEVLQVDAIFER